MIKFWRTSLFQGRIGRQLAISYLAIALFGVAILAGWSIITLRNSNVALIRKDAETVLSQSVEAITYRIRQIKSISNQISLSRDLQTLLSGSLDLVDLNLQLKNYFMPSAYATLRQSTVPLWVNIELDDPILPQIYYDPPVDTPFVRGSFIEIHYLQHAASDKNSGRNAVVNPRFGWEQDARDRKYGTISLKHQLLLINALSPMGQIRVRIDTKSLFTELNTTRPLGSSFRITADNGDVIYSSSGKAATSAEKTLASRNIPEADWVLEMIAPDEVLLQGSESLILASILVAVLVLVISFSAGLIFATSITRRIDQVVSSLQSFEDGDFHVRLDMGGDDEFGKIARAFNTASDTIEKLIATVYQVELEKKEAAFNLLQAQINPHFLYNSLSSISRLSKLRREGDVHRLVMSLARFYRMGLAKGKDWISLEEEFDLTQAWCEVQAIKRDDRFKYTLTLAPELASVYCPKMILQPFAENSVEHGSTDLPLELKISARRELDQAVLEIRDNGTGMNQATLHELMTQSGANIGFGVYNVRQRLHLSYGYAATLTIDSRPDRGTTVRIRIPVDGMMKQTQKKDI